MNTVNWSRVLVKKVLPWGTSLMVQWLRHCVSKAGDTGLTLVGELGSHMSHETVKKKRKFPPEN